MEFSLDELILLYLEDCAEYNAVQYISSQEIREAFINYYVANNFEALRELEYINAIHYLLGNYYIEEDTEHYRITSKGRDHAYQLLHPQLPYEQMSYMAQKTSNAIGRISILVAIIGLIVTIAYSRSHSITTSELFTQVQPISLSTATDQNNIPVQLSTQSFWFSDAIYNDDLSRIPFILSSESYVIETESQYSSNRSSIKIPVNNKGVVRIHILINMSYGSLEFTGGSSIIGKNVSTITLVGDKGEAVRNLQAGKDIREWVIGATNSVNTIGGNVKTIWTGLRRGTETTAVIDYVVIEVPQKLREGNLEYMVIEDNSQSLFNSVNPGIMIFGLAVEYYK